MKIKLGSSLLSKSFAPGPGNYDISVTNRKSSPRFGFGTSTRETGKGKKLDVPGPGTYKLRPLVSDAPAYSMKQNDLFV